MYHEADAARRGRRSWPERELRGLRFSRAGWARQELHQLRPDSLSESRVPIESLERLSESAVGGRQRVLREEGGDLLAMRSREQRRGRRDQPDALLCRDATTEARPALLDEGPGSLSGVTIVEQSDQEVSEVLRADLVREGQRECLVDQLGLREVCELISMVISFQFHALLRCQQCYLSVVNAK